MNVNVSLTDELNDFVQAQVSSGRYGSADEVVREALRLLEEAEASRLAFLRAAWAEGQASEDAGPLDGSSIKEQARRGPRSSGR
ncbi:type II toxin-antitoxin system ParD family antitoxin [Bradyrhizobium sp. STM 3557]|uniref:type II toxin-antitoxin system ParD family antitoxin n=1 Tax=Bradyrhizobium sp. STM 3557 TaxID=578920 RepID=UPI00388CF4DE